MAVAELEKTEIEELEERIEFLKNKLEMEENHGRMLEFGQSDRYDIMRNVMTISVIQDQIQSLERKKTRLNPMNKWLRKKK